jgi:mannose-6-phosphate isomerase-like protein (cupin superfamily)
MGTKYQPQAEYYFKEGCYIQEWLNSPSHEDLSIARARVLPNQETVLHYLENTAEKYVILSGEGVVSVAGKRWSVAPGDVVVIDAGEHQNIKNTGSLDLIFLAVCTPRFELPNYHLV